MVLSELAEMVPTWAISSRLFVDFESFFSSSMIASTPAVDAALERHRVVAGGDHLGAFGDDRAREHRGCRGAVTGDVGGLRCDLFHHLRAHVFEPVFELDLLGHGDAVLRDVGRAPRLFENDVATAGSEGDGDRVGQLFDAAEQFAARFLTEIDDL